MSLLGCFFIWIVTPYNNFLLRNGFISEDYLAHSVMALLLFLILVVNPLLRAARPKWALSFKQMAFIAAVLFVACTITSSGLLRYVPYSLATQTRNASEWLDTAEFYEDADLPPSLFPAELGHRADVDVAKHFLLKLPAGESIPWGAWLGPALSWGCFFILLWMLAIGLAGILLPQWQQTERMPMPLTHVLQSVFETPEEGRLLAPIFRNRWFWLAAAAVFSLHLMGGLSIYFPSRVPSIDAQWDLSGLFAEEPLNYMPDYMRSGRIYFTFLGVAYFMATRVSFSLWFFMLLYAFQTMFWQMYAPPFPTGVPGAQRSGAIIVVVCSILWLSRARWLHVFRCLFLGDGRAGTSQPEGTGPGGGAGEPKGTWLRWGSILAGAMVALVLLAEFFPVWVVVGLVVVVLAASLRRPLHSDENRRDRQFALMFVVGGFGMFAWHVWGGMQAHWALVLVAMIFVYQLVIARLLAETGLPLMGLDPNHLYHAFQFFPMRLFSPTSAWYIGVQAGWQALFSRVSMTAMVTQSMSLDEEAGPRHQWRMGRVLLGVLVLGFVVCGATHLYFSYNHSQSLDRNPEMPISAFGSAQLAMSVDFMRQQERGAWDRQPYNRPLHVALGAAVGGVLQYACLTMPRWPLHPAGLVLSYTWYTQTLWISVLFGWLARVTILLFGGARLFRKLRPMFIGLIIGEIMAVIFWGAVSGLLAFSGRPYFVVQVLPF